MSESVSAGLFFQGANDAVVAEASGTSASTRTSNTGILPYQLLRTMWKEREIVAPSCEIEDNQFQPSSLDLRLGPYAFRVKASFLPGPNATIREKIRQLDGYQIDLTNGAVLEKGCVYVVPLLESVALKGTTDVVGIANPKSSTGRLDILTRLITDYSVAFDRIERGYKGPLYIEIAPRTFSIVVKTGTRLNQVRFRRGSKGIATTELQRLHKEGALVRAQDAQPTTLKDKMVGVTIDLVGTGKESLVGYRAKKHTDRIDVEKIGHYDPADFWEPIYNHRDPAAIVLNPDDFYILVTRESVSIPPTLAAEMIAYDTSVGEFRVHYAGFFDPGFGWGTPNGSKAVLEVRSHEVPFMLEHGQTVGWLNYEPLVAEPDKLYGREIGSNYQRQSLALAKQFKSS